MAIISENNLEEFKAYILEGKTIPELQEIYSCSRSTITLAKKKFNLVGLSSNFIARDVDKLEKVCLECKESKPLTEYYSNGRTQTGKKKYKPRCKVCDGELRVERRRTIFLTIFLRYLASVGRQYKCESCGYDRNYAALEFHHRDTKTKDFNISSISVTSSEEVILEKLNSELPKCDILCANCHREVHNPNSRKQ